MVFDPRRYGGYGARVVPEAETKPKIAEILKRAVVPLNDLTPAERIRFEHERIEFNERRLIATFPVLILVQIGMIWLFVKPAEGAAETFRRGIWWVHFTTAPMIASIWAAAIVSSRQNRRLSWLGDVAVVISTFFGMWLSLTTHRMLPTNNSYFVALFAAALILRSTLPGAVLGFFGSMIAFTIFLEYVQPSREVRISFVSTSLTAVAVSFVFSRALFVGAVREFRQRLTIERQQDELRSWNAELEKRVETQVQEALLREREARALEARLRMKVRAHSQELVQAILDGAPEDEALTPGVRFEQQFIIERELGSGAMGDVYAARDVETEQLVAIKLMRRWDGMSPSDVGRFAMEAAATAAVVHPAIVRTFHVDVTSGGRLYLVMEFVAGQTLAEAIFSGRFDAAQTAALGAIVAEALAVAHKAGVIHRDIKPSNMMLTNVAPGLRILDFGISKLAVPGSVYQTVAGQIMGTPQYMAPEQILGGGGATGACDVYALGLVLHEMLRGEPTFSAKNLGELMRAQMTVVPQSLREQFGADVPEELSQIVAQCLEKEAASRPSADDVARALRHIADSLHAGPLEKIGAPRYKRDVPKVDDLAPTISASSGDS